MQYEVQSNGLIFGTYDASSEQEARDLCAQNAGYKDEADMERRLWQISEFKVRLLEAEMQVQSNILSTAAAIIKTGEARTASFAVMKAMEESGNIKATGFGEYVQALNQAGYKTGKKPNQIVQGMFLDFLAFANS